MRPTLSIIFFTVISGAGYGLLFLTGFGIAIAWPVAPYEVVAFDDFNFASAPLVRTMQDPRTALVFALAAGFALASAGLLASVAHLGQPRRAWRAFSQWRSSWLSREGVSAVFTMLPLSMLVVLLLGKAPDAATILVMRICGALLAVASMLT